jgi:hypothetical protein
MNTIKAGDLIRVTFEKSKGGDTGVGYVYHSVDGDPTSELLVDLSWSTGGSTECAEVSSLGEENGSTIEAVTLTKL